jgi:hypothetical protein
MLPPDVVVKLNECAKTDFVSVRDWWFSFTSWATALVAFGLVLEAPELIHDLIPMERRTIAWLRRSSSSESPKRETPDWVKVVAFVGWIFIVVGVIGEGRGGIKVNNLDTNIQECSDAKVREATIEAGDAAQSAKTAHDEADAVKGIAKAADLDAKGAQAVADAVASKAEKLEVQLADAKAQVESIEAKRVELEKSLTNLAVCNAPRVISNWFLFGNGGVAINNQVALPGVSKSYIDSLRPMAGQMVFIEVVPDAEARRAALSIARTLADAQWNVQTPLKFVDGLEDGVSVQPSEPTLTGLANGEIPNMNPYWHASDIANKLVEFLHSYNWQATRGWPLDPQGKMIRDEKVLAAGAIRIQIGLYPAAVYVSPPGQKELTSRMEELKQEREKAEAESKRKLEEHWATFPPEVRERLQQAKAEMDAKAKSETSNGPCQVLDPLF